MLKNVLKNTMVVLTIAIAVITANGCHAANQAERQRQASVSLSTKVMGVDFPFCAGVAVGKNTILTQKHCTDMAAAKGVMVFYNGKSCPEDKVIAFDGVENVLVRTCQTYTTTYQIKKVGFEQGEKITHYGHPLGGPMLYREGYYLQNYDTSLGSSALFDINVAKGDSGGPVFDSDGRLVCTLSFQIFVANNPFNIGGCYPPKFTTEQLKEIK